MFWILIKNNSEIIILVLLALVLFSIIWVIFLQLGISQLKKKNKEIFAGAKGKDLEQIILKQAKSLKILDKEIQELYEISNQINNLALRSIHKVGIIRFNPFKDVGGNQSFAIALLNGKDNGIVISSLYTREGTRVYSKDVQNGISEKFPLTEEEEEAIKMAKKTIQSGKELKKIN